MARIKWFDDIIICPGIKSGYFILQCGKAAQKHDREMTKRGRRRATHKATQIQSTLLFWQHFTDQDIGYVLRKVMPGLYQRYNILQQKPTSQGLLYSGTYSYIIVY
jgi:hypothetical protein